MRKYLPILWMALLANSIFGAINSGGVRQWILIFGAITFIWLLAADLLEHS